MSQVVEKYIYIVRVKMQWRDPFSSVSRHVICSYRCNENLYLKLYVCRVMKLFVISMKLEQENEMGYEDLQHQKVVTTLCDTRQVNEQTWYPLLVLEILLTQQLSNSFKPKALAHSSLFLLDSNTNEAIGCLTQKFCGIGSV